MNCYVLANLQALFYKDRQVVEELQSNKIKKELRANCDNLNKRIY